MRIALGSPAVVELLINLDLGNGSATPVLQKFPTTVAPRVGETIAVEGGEYEVTHVNHVLNASTENRHTVWLDVKRIK